MDYQKEILSLKKAVINKRVNVLNKQLITDSESITSKELEELKSAKKLLETLDELAREGLSKKQYSIKTSETDEWMLALLKAWIVQHPEVNRIVDGHISSIFKFAIAFFVESVILNPKNNHLQYEELVYQLNHLLEPDKTTRKIARDLKDMKSQLSFLTSMQFEENTLPMEARVLTPKSFDQLRTGIDPQSDLGMALKRFVEKRNQELVARKTSQSTNRTSW